MNWFGRDGGVGDNGQESNDRPGKFPDISKFMTTEGFHHKDISGTQAPVDRGHIIYIKDPSAKETRINDRVMLVLRHNPPFSYTCLSFYHYNFSGETLHNSHALVYTDQGQRPDVQAALAQQPNASLSPLEIQLHHNRTPFSLKPYIYLNLRELWNVEQDVRFVVLGQAERDSYEKLLPEIKRLFCESLASADNIRDSRAPPAPNTN